MGSSGFFLICVLHSAAALTCGALRYFTPKSSRLRTSDSFSGLLLFAMGFLLFMVAGVKDWEFQSFFAKGCVLLHMSMAVWRFHFERKLEDLAHDWPRHAVGDIALATSWSSFLCAHGERNMISYCKRWCLWMNMAKEQKE